MTATLATKENSKKNSVINFFEKIQTNGQIPLKLIYFMMNLNTISLPTKTMGIKFWKEYILFIEMKFLNLVNYSCEPSKK
jgi:hypothetical protein